MRGKLSFILCIFVIYKIKAYSGKGASLWVVSTVIKNESRFVFVESSPAHFESMTGFLCARTLILYISVLMKIMQEQILVLKGGENIGALNKEFAFKQ